MNLKETIDYLNDQKHVNIKPGLETIRALMSQLGDPQRGLRFVHIAGTNGKGSTASFIENTLRHAGYRTGIFTSPYLDHFTEKIRVCGEEIPDDTLIRLTARVREAAEKLEDTGLFATPFELQTAVAFLFFAESACDIAVLEVGLGGRLDSTNIIDTSEVSVITSLGMDHMAFLGDTIEKIAAEKAGIIKPNGCVVSAPQKSGAAEVIREKCQQQHAALTFIHPEEAELLHSGIDGQTFRAFGKEYHISLPGTHQIENAMLAAAALDVLRTRGFQISPEAESDGFAATRWQGRMEVLSTDPVFIIDGAHNPEGVRSLRKSLDQLFPDQKITFITGVLADKDYLPMMRTMEPIAREFYTLTPDSPRALPAADLAAQLRDDGCKATPCQDIRDALSLLGLLAGTDQSDSRKAGIIGDSSDYNDKTEVICVFGSLYMIGAVRLVYEKELQK